MYCATKTPINTWKQRTSSHNLGEKRRNVLSFCFEFQQSAKLQEFRKEVTKFANTTKKFMKDYSYLFQESIIPEPGEYQYFKSRFAVENYSKTRSQVTKPTLSGIHLIVFNRK